MNIKQLSRKQLLAIDTAVEVFLFAETGEPFADTYTKDPEHFKKLMAMLIAYKRDIGGFFNDQYDMRYWLLNYPQDTNLNLPYWDESEKDLAKVIHKHNSLFFDLGIAAFIAATATAVQLHSTDTLPSMQITDHALKVSGDINTVTQNRVKAQIESAMKLGEDRAAFDLRMKKVFKNPYRGRFISQNEALQSYLDAKDDASVETGMKFKTWIGSQLNPLEVCGSVMGQTIPIDQTFSNGFDAPLAHLGCRCDIVYSISE